MSPVVAGSLSTSVKTATSPSMVGCLAMTLTVGVVWAWAAGASTSAAATIAVAVSSLSVLICFVLLGGCSCGRSGSPLANEDDNKELFQ